MSVSNQNLFASLPQPLPQEVVEVLVNAGKMRIERIVSHGHASPDGFWYDQEEHEWVTVLQGEAELEWSDQPAQRLKAGDHLLIAAHRRHRVRWTSSNELTIWLAVFFTA